MVQSGYLRKVASRTKNGQRFKRTYSIQTHHITIDLGKIATTALTSSTAHDSICAATLPGTSAKDSLSSIFYCEALFQHPQNRVESIHVHTRASSLTAYTASSSRTSIGSTLECGHTTPTSQLERKSVPQPESPLVEVENNSKFFSQELICSSCGKKGPNFPKCGKCDRVWCSRDCRLRGAPTHDCVQHKLKSNFRRHSDP